MRFLLARFCGAAVSPSAARGGPEASGRLRSVLRHSAACSAPLGPADHHGAVRRVRLPAVEGAGGVRSGDDLRARRRGTGVAESE